MIHRMFVLDRHPSEPRPKPMTPTSSSGPDIFAPDLQPTPYCVLLTHFLLLRCQSALFLLFVTCRRRMRVPTAEKQSVNHHSFAQNLPSATFRPRRLISQSSAMDHLGFQVPGMAPPPLMNQPPQIFGGYNGDGLPNVSQMPPDLAAHMFPEAHLLMEDTNEAKRRRIARVSRNPPFTSPFDLSMPVPGY